MKFSHPKLIIHSDMDGLSSAAADIATTIARMSIAKRGQFNLVLAGGGTPLSLYRLLSNDEVFPNTLWAHTHLFWGDERNVPPDHDDSNYKAAYSVLISRIEIPRNQIQRIRGELDSPAAAEDYSHRLAKLAAKGKKWPRFDLVLLGMGDDGHTASLFPDSPINKADPRAAIPVKAHYEGRPADRVTLTPAVFNSARNIMFLISGSDKADALAATIEGPEDPVRWPVQRIRPVDGEIIWIIDSEAASNLSNELAR